MLMKCTTCAKDLIPTRKNILNCSEWIIWKQKKQPEGGAIKEESESEQNYDKESESEQNDDPGNKNFKTTTT